MKNKLLIILTFSLLLAGAVVIYLNDETLNINTDRSTRSRTPTPETTDMLLPDLLVLTPEELFIDYDQGNKLLRFSSAFINQGAGPLEMVGETDEEQRITIATQRIQKTDGSIEEREVGRFVFHPEHDHWHTEKFTVFEIWSIGEDGEREELISNTDKLSFCIYDEEEFDLRLKNAPEERQYPGCAENDIQGLSVGWTDIYEADISGQEIDITNLLDGEYIVRSIINPDQNILESDYDNNDVSDHIIISGDEVTKSD